MSDITLLTAQMNTVIQFTADEEAKALPILLRHSPGALLSNHTYVVDHSVTQVLRDAGVSFNEVRPQFNIPIIEEASIGERI